MNTDDIRKLATLCRIEIPEDEAAALEKDMKEILGFVDDIASVATEEPVPEVGWLHNVMREDGTPHEAGVHTEALLSAAPEREGSYVKVKKIL